MIDVYVNGGYAGTLGREGRDHVFTYHTADKNLFVSLTMPVRQKSYTYPGEHVHPVFDMFIPEGYLFEVFKNLLAKSMGKLDEFGLLSVLAPGIAGRLTFISQSERGKEKETVIPPTIGDIIRGPDDIFSRLLDMFLMRSAVSGIQPKVLAELRRKTRLNLEDYIIKTYGDEYPALAENEYFCLLAAQRAGIPVPEFRVSDNKKLILIKRFDRAGEKNGEQGFEELCALMGKNHSEKYDGSYEQVAKTVKTFVAPEHIAASLEQLYKTIIISAILRNGDAHLKNFGILYRKGHQDAVLAPSYDIVTTACYLRNDVPALTLDGKKTWWSKRKLLQFGELHCLVPLRRAKELCETCEESVAEVHREVIGYMKENPSFRAVGERMLKCWGEGLSARG